jgi:hypothetical protein
MSIKAPSRGASGAAPKLETVQESSLPATPGFDGIEADRYGLPHNGPTVLSWLRTMQLLRMENPYQPCTLLAPS